MSGNVFLDTNVFVYSFDTTAPSKQQTATALIRQVLQDGSGVISSQVVQEFINVAMRKFSVPLTPGDCRKYFETVLASLCRVYANSDLYLLALEVMERWGYAFYDSLVIAAAVQSDCRILYSEDLHDGHNIMGLTIVNPFQV